jgi:L-alanine-DL-glutamate epimerase-like enolase superfamily enzyme
MNVYWLEEPLPRYDFDHIAELNKLVEIKIAGGEANHQLHEFRWLLERNAYDIIQPEIMTEGPNLMRKYAVLAESMNKLCIPHVGNQLGNICSMHLVASWPNAPYFEIFNDPPSSEMRYSNGIYENPPLFKDGYLMMPDGPGLGVAIDKDFIAT